MKTFPFPIDEILIDSGPKVIMVTKEPPEIKEQNFELLVSNVRSVYQAGKTRSVKFRLQQLRNFGRMMTENKKQILGALDKDLKKPYLESEAYEVQIVLKEIRCAIKNIKTWAKKTCVPKNLLALTDTLYITKEPFGVVLIMGTWNYPIQLTLGPLCGAICAGNVAIIKPSEMSSHTSQLIADLVPKYLDEECYKVVLGGPDVAQGLLQQKFDYIFYTGSCSVGKLIHSAANKYLTPCTLELGGKCPVYIDDSVNFRLTAERVMWAKCVCLGQTCVAPDYIICTKDVEDKFVKECKKVMKQFFGNNMQDSRDIARIINTRHFARLRKLLAETSGKIVMGGNVDEYDLWFEPTIISDVGRNDSIMNEEIFGPLLPIVSISSPEEALKFINEKPSPLALYVYSKNSKVIKTFLNNTQSGAVSINDSLYHVGVGELPFGGVGPSGMGQYHGKYSFETFSRPRSVLHRSFCFIDNANDINPRYPPYTSIKSALVKVGVLYHHYFYLDFFFFLPYICCVILGILIMALFDHSNEVLDFIKSL